MFAADFLLAFDDEGQIARQFRAGFQIRLDGLEMRQVLALVVGRAARVKGMPLMRGSNGGDFHKSNGSAGCTS